MKALWIAVIAILSLIGMGLSRPAQADDLQQDCNQVYVKLQVIKGAAIGRRDGIFTDISGDAYYYRVRGGVHYYGCIISLYGNHKEVTGDTGMNDFYTESDNPWAREGWRTDESEDADGPDGTHFKEVKGDIVCLFDGHWDGGEDGNPQYIPSPLFEYDIACGKKVN